MKQVGIEGLPEVPGCKWRLSQTSYTPSHDSHPNYWLTLLKNTLVLESALVPALEDEAIVVVANRLVGQWDQRSRYRLVSEGPIELVAK